MTASIVIERPLFVPRQLVLDAWIEPAQLTAWYPPDGSSDPLAAVDPEPGGGFEVSWMSVDGHREREVGRFVAVRMAEGFELALADSDPALPRPLVLKVFEQDGAGALSVTRELTPGDDPAECRARWEARLERLEAYFSAI